MRFKTFDYNVRNISYNVKSYKEVQNILFKVQIELKITNCINRVQKIDLDISTAQQLTLQNNNEVDNN